MLAMRTPDFFATMPFVAPEQLAAMRTGDFDFSHGDAF